MKRNNSKINVESVEASLIVAVKSANGGGRRLGAEYNLQNNSLYQKQNMEIVLVEYSMTPPSLFFCYITRMGKKVHHKDKPARIIKRLNH